MTGASGASVTSSSVSKVDTVDPVWGAVLAGAKEIAGAEPALASFVMAAVLAHESFDTALAYRLSERLGHADVPADLIRRTFDDLLEDEPQIGAISRVDLAATLERDPACHRAIEPLLYLKGYQAIQTHRFAHALWARGRKDLAFYLQSRSSQVFQADIHPAVRIGRGIMLDHGTGLVIGETAEVGDQVSILQAVTLGGTGKEDGDRHPKVGSGVLIGAGAKILGNIRIGVCARIAAGSVVLKDVPARKTVAGVPARIIGEVDGPQPATVMDQMVTRDDEA